MESGPLLEGSPKREVERSLSEWMPSIESSKKKVGGEKSSGWERKGELEVLGCGEKKGKGCDRRQHNVGNLWIF